MPKDNRKILNSVRGGAGQVFRDGMEDELAAALDQKRIDELVAGGVLAGDWTSLARGAISISGDAPSARLASRIADEGMTVIGSRGDEFKPLPLEETMKRFEEFDFSDEVMRSVQFHKDAIKNKVGGGLSESDFGREGGKNSVQPNAGANDSTRDDSTNNRRRDDEEFPENFPARSKFIKADKTFAEVKTLSREKLIEIDGIAEKTADEVLAFIADFNK